MTPNERSQTANLSKKASNNKITLAHTRRKFFATSAIKILLTQFQFANLSMGVDMTGVIHARSNACGVITIPAEFEFNHACYVQLQWEGLHPFLEVHDARKKTNAMPSETQNDKALTGSKIKLFDLFEFPCENKTFVVVNLESHLEIWPVDTWTALQAECLSVLQLRS